MASLDNPFYAYRVAGSGSGDWTIVEVTDGSFPESFTGLGNTEYEVKTKIWSESAFITTGDASFFGQFGTPAIAFSLRDLGLTNSNVIRVRRTSDNTEQDFTASEITDGTLLAFTGAGSGVITTWYNQGSLSLNPVQTNAAKQPRIVSSGVLTLQNGNPTAFFGGSRNLIAAAGLGTSIANFTSFEVSKRDTNTSRQNTWATADASSYGGSTNFVLRRSDGINEDLNISNPSSSEVATIASGTNQVITTSKYIGGTSVNIAINNGAYSTQTTAVPVTISPNSVFEIGSILDGVQLHSGNIQEIIIYLSDEESQKASILTNINAYYSVY